MKLKLRHYPSARNELRYLLTVSKSFILYAEYIIEFRKGICLIPFLSSYYSEEELVNSTLMVDFFDFRALTDISGNNKFDKITEMHYSGAQLERLFIEGIAEAIFDVVSQTAATIVFSAPYTEALARYYHRLLKKYAGDVNYKYREDIRKEANFYVIETDRRKQNAATSLSPDYDGSA